MFVGNSFSVDTMGYAAEIARSLGIERVKLGTLFFDGCSIELHYQHAIGDCAVYTYYTNEGDSFHESDLIGKDF